MTRIIYGVSGEGSGHSSRAREMASHLLERGHDVRLVSYDRGYRNLCGDFNVFENEGLTIASQDNKVSVVKTFTENLKRLPEGFEKLQSLRQSLFKDFDPHCVITDFEPMTAYLANYYNLPLITIDNQHRMRYMEYDCPLGLESEQGITLSVIRAMVPRPDVSLVTTFYTGAVRNERTFLFPPILRQNVLEQRPTDAGHILVYLTSGYDTLLGLLDQFPHERFLVYGYERDEQVGRVTYRPFSKDRFLHDLATSRAVVATAGFTLISESLHLGKPYLAMPMKGQFEQELNGFMLARLGYGKCAAEVSVEALGDFLYRLPEYREALSGYPRRDNRELKAKLDTLVRDDARLARQFHHNRDAK